MQNFPSVRQQPLQEDTRDFAWPVFSPHSPGHHGPSLGRKPRLPAVCHPGSGLRHSPARKGDLQGGPTVTTEAACQPPERLGQPSAIPSVHPPGLSRLQMRSLQLDPKEGRRLCKAPLPSPFQTKGSRSSKGWWVGAEKAGTLSPREGFGTITCPSPAPKDPESSREELWAPASQPRAQCRLTSLGESWALVWGQSGTKVLEKGQDTQSGMAMPHNAPAPASTEATW